MKVKLGVSNAGILILRYKKYGSSISLYFTFKYNKQDISTESFLTALTSKYVQFGYKSVKELQGIKTSYTNNS